MSFSANELSFYVLNAGQAEGNSLQLSNQASVMHRGGPKIELE
jgi:hypothetical protein